MWVKNWKSEVLDRDWIGLLEPYGAIIIDLLLEIISMRAINYWFEIFEIAYLAIKL